MKILTLICLTTILISTGLLIHDNKQITTFVSKPVSILDVHLAECKREGGIPILIYNNDGIIVDANCLVGG